MLIFVADFFAVVEQQLKKCCGDKLVLGCFFGLGFVASAGCVWKSLEMFGKVWESEKSAGKC